MFSMFLSPNPVPASRPRVTRWGCYYGKTYTKWMKEVEDHIKSFGVTKSSALVVLVEVFRPKPKTTKKHWPRGDVDNYAKGPLDSITKHSDIWDDDDQIVGLWVSKQWAIKDTGIWVTIFDIGD